MKKYYLFFLLFYFKINLFAQKVNAIHVSQVAKVRDKNFKIILKSDGTLSIYNYKTNLIQRINQTSLYYGNAGFESLEFIDFNGDNHKDLLIHYMTNVPDVCDLLLYNSKKQKFIIVSNFTSFPVPKIIRGNKLYYSYRRSGCADLDWNSDLFAIKNYKAVAIGNIFGKECEGDGPNRIEISRIKGTNKVLFKRLPISTIRKYKNDKWGFIKAFWTNNCDKFI